MPTSSKTRRFEYIENEDIKGLIDFWTDNQDVLKDYSLDGTTCATAHPWGICFSPLTVTSPDGTKFEVETGQELLWENEVFTVAGKKKLYTSKAWCYKRYVIEKKTERQMAEEAETNQSTIHRWLVKHEIL